MSLKKRDTPEVSEFWKFVERTSTEVATWPAWKTGGHTCAEGHTCVCSQLADTPDETCLVHGAGIWPPRCESCGRFLKWKLDIKVETV